MKQAVISLEGITKTYVNGKLVVPVLHGIDLNIYEGEFTSIMGPSGSGKSTFMNILGCLDRPTSGSYKLDGEEVATLSDDELAFVRNKRIGFVFQSFNLLPKLTAQDNVALPMVYAGVPKRNAKSGPPIFWIRWGSVNGSTIYRRNYPVVSASVWLSPALWPTPRPLLWPTNRPVTWIPSPVWM